jgi:hypothetical protein
MGRSEKKIEVSSTSSKKKKVEEEGRLAEIAMVKQWMCGETRGRIAWLRLREGLEPGFPS